MIIDLRICPCGWLMTSIITLTHNKLAVTRRCLPTWLSGHDSDIELIVVDNGSDDGTPEWLKNFQKESVAAGVPLILICNAENAGCSTARNQGLAEASGDKVVFLDNDVAPRTRGWLKKLKEALLADKRRVLVGPKLVYPFPPHLIQCAGVGISRTGRVLFRGRGEPGDRPAWNEPGEVQCLISACWVGHTEVLREAGGFDEAFNPVQFEDFDLCYRLKERGGRLWYEPAVEMYHLESVTTQGTPTLANAEIVIRHGLLFKKRWKHLFEKEDGPADAETRWRKVELPPLEELGDLPLV